MPEMEDAGFEVPPAPWEYDDSGEDGSDSGSDSQGAGYAEMRNQYNEADIGAGGSAVGDNDQGAGYAEMRNQYNAAGIGAGGSAPYEYSQDATAIGVGGSAPSNISQGEGWNLMRDQYNTAGIGAGGSAARDISQGEGWKIMRDQYNAAGLGAGGTAPEPQNRWEAASLPNLLAWGAGYGNAMGQTPQQMVKWANQSIQQWNSAHPDDQYPLLQPVVGPRIPTGARGGGGGYGPNANMTPEEYIRYLENRLKYGGLLRL